jgi:hypothetical protein
MVVEVVVPGSALLVPGVAGRTDPLVQERARVLAELDRALLGRPGAPRDAGRGIERVEVRPAAGAGGPASRLVPDLGALGIDPRWSRWSFTGNDDTARGHAGGAATVALLALGAAGWDEPVDVVEAAGAVDRSGSVVVVVRRAEP